MSINWSAEQKRVLARFDDLWGMLPDYQRRLTGYSFTDSDTGKRIDLRIADVINEVSRLTELGKKIIVAEKEKMEKLGL